MQKVEELCDMPEGVCSSHTRLSFKFASACGDYGADTTSAVANVWMQTRFVVH